MNLREQVAQAILGAATEDDPSVGLHPDFVDAATDAVLVVVAERERAIRQDVAALMVERERGLRERIEALPRFERSALLRSNGAWISRRDVLGVFDDES